jgi:hypothetical protein
MVQAALMRQPFLILQAPDDDTRCNAKRLREFNNSVLRWSIHDELCPSVWRYEAIARKLVRFILVLAAHSLLFKEQDLFTMQGDMPALMKKCKPEDIVA